MVLDFSLLGRMISTRKEFFTIEFISPISLASHSYLLPKIAIQTLINFLSQIETEKLLAQLVDSEMTRRAVSLLTLSSWQ